MPQLPAIITREAEALAFARERIASIRDDDETLQHVIPGTHARASLFDPEAGRLLDKRLLMEKALRSTTDMLEVVTWARGGDRSADAAVREIANEFKNRGERIPTLIGAYDIEATAGAITHLRGKTKADAVLRDIAVCIVIGLVCERFTMTPTRNPGRTGARASACAIVCQALKEELRTFTPSERGVETIWRKFGLGLFPNRGASPKSN